jgi:uncharacterized protein
MDVWIRRLWLCAFAMLLGAQVCFAANLKSAERAYDKAEQARKKRDNATAKKEYAAALKAFAPLAKKGNADAEYYLGKMYLLGQGVSEDREEAIKLLKASGDQGNADAQFFLGSMYLLPRKDIKQGLMWMRLSAEQGNKDAQLLLGQTYMQGIKELPRDLVQADMWMRLAAKGNHLLFYHLQVEGVERQMSSADIEKAKVLAAAWKPKHGLRPDQGEALKSKPESIGTR